MIVGTLGSEIYELPIDKKFNINLNTAKNIMKGHFAPNPLWTN